MAQFLTTHGTAYNIEKIIQSAKRDLFLVSPFLQVSKILNDRLIDADEKGVKIHIIFGKDELKPDQRNQLEKLKNLRLFFSENLHAKCYFNEAFMIITSMNMYEFSEKNNKEMGVLISRVEDREVFSKAEEEVHSIMKKSDQIYIDNTVNKQQKYSNNFSQKSFRRAYCIRCGIDIPYDISKPYCYSCYEVWRNFGNPFYEERFCHSCGKPDERTTMEKPECYECYKSKSF